MFLTRPAYDLQVTCIPISTALLPCSTSPLLWLWCQKTLFHKAGTVAVLTQALGPRHVPWTLWRCVLQQDEFTREAWRWQHHLDSRWEDSKLSCWDCSGLLDGNGGVEVMTMKSPPPTLTIQWKKSGSVSLTSCAWCCIMCFYSTLHRASAGAIQSAESVYAMNQPSFPKINVWPPMPESAPAASPSTAIILQWHVDQPPVTLSQIPAAYHARQFWPPMTSSDSTMHPPMHACVSPLTDVQSMIFALHTHIFTVHFNTSLIWKWREYKPSNVSTGTVSEQSQCLNLSMLSTCDTGPIMTWTKKVKGNHILLLKQLPCNYIFVWPTTPSTFRGRCNAVSYQPLHCHFRCEDNERSDHSPGAREKALQTPSPTKQTGLASGSLGIVPTPLDQLLKLHVLPLRGPALTSPLLPELTQLQEPWALMLMAGLLKLGAQQWLHPQAAIAEETQLQSWSLGTVLKRILSNSHYLYT